IISLTRTAY
ncbi:hypothetical protein MPH_13338, partial [Macrophomina phaseolina MS6]